MSQIRLGIDVGGSGIKGALVDVESGELVSERIKVLTPQPATPEAVTRAAASVMAQSGYNGPVGVGFPAIVADGVIRTANNVDKSWIGVHAPNAFGEALGVEVLVTNDADSAAMCEARFGAARGVNGLVIVLTFGSGIGSGFIIDGVLLPNVELGAMELDGYERAEFHYSARARKTDGLSFGEWGERANRFLGHVNDVFSPKLMVVGGGVARKWDKWGDRLDETLPVVRAARANNAGIVGAATLVG